MKTCTHPADVKGKQAMDFLVQLEQSGIGTWIRDSGSVFGYPLILFFHTLGLALLVGLNAAIDLRILGFAPDVSITELEKTFPLMWLGFAINATTGTLLFISDATRHFSNPAFFVKLLFIAFALVNLVLIRKRVFRDPLAGKRPVQIGGKVLAVTSLSFWLVAITAGRLMAYVSEFVVG